MDRISTQLYSHPLCGGVVGPLREDLVKKFLRGDTPEYLPLLTEADYLVVHKDRTPCTFLYERRVPTPFSSEGFDKVAEICNYDPATIINIANGLPSPFKLIIVPSIGDYTTVERGSALDTYLMEKLGGVKSFADLPTELQVPRDILPRTVNVLFIVSPDGYWGVYSLPCMGRLFGVILPTDWAIDSMLRVLSYEDELGYLIWDALRPR